MKTLFAAVLALSCVATQALADVVVIGNPAGPDSISASQVRDIYLNRSQQLPDGQKAVPFELQSGNPVRADFHGKITNRNDAQLKAFWSQQVFTGRGGPPPPTPSSRRSGPSRCSPVVASPPRSWPTPAR
ncbi:phosphate ABC transporter substrate-binding protein [Marinobacter xestospongiae]|uniref:Phosphate ABC transporter substrate-binding protein n=1 Tax=Marinobacter xestospongiae TaxID=994319 RepID=A0ABU3VX20_9GAMM|nr:phosphate ABC transporter substrate-binding protein [Marinobacter xestospongiae]MDV2078818.1 phosphate ABC transporter substrate-binding protein [Marinobacter xestospongiae]